MLADPVLAKAWAFDRSKTTVESDARRRRRRNTQLLQVGLPESERALFLQAAANKRCKAVEDVAERLSHERAAAAGQECCDSWWAFRRRRLGRR